MNSSKSPHNLFFEGKREVVFLTVVFTVIALVVFALLARLFSRVPVTVVEDESAVYVSPEKRQQVFELLQNRASSDGAGSVTPEKRQAVFKLLENKDAP